MFCFKDVCYSGNLTNSSPCCLQLHCVDLEIYKASPLLSQRQKEGEIWDREPFWTQRFSLSATLLLKSLLSTKKMHHNPFFFKNLFSFRRVHNFKMQLFWTVIPPFNNRSPFAVTSFFFSFQLELAWPCDSTKRFTVQKHVHIRSKVQDNASKQ